MACIHTLNQKPSIMKLLDLYCIFRILCTITSMIIAIQATQLAMKGSKEASGTESHNKTHLA